MKTFTISDIHGNFKALKEVLEKSKFDYKKDKLIILGDVVDGYPQTKEVIEELLKIKNKVLLIGNHDLWAATWMLNGSVLPSWWLQGGEDTAKSYGFNYKNVPKEHIEFLDSAVPYYEENGNVFVHGGFKFGTHPKDNPLSVLVWDRELIFDAAEKPVPGFKTVFVGHTCTQIFGRYPDILDCNVPLFFNNLIMMDVGAGFIGKLAIMDVYTKEFWLSSLYKPEVEDGRRKR